MSGEFAVHQFLAGDINECLGRGLDAKAAVDLARSYTMPSRPAVAMGIIRRVIITDGDDFTCFEWKHGEGVTYPPESAGRV